MQRKLKLLFVIGIVGVGVAVAAYGGTVLANAPIGVSVTTLASVAQFDEIDAKAKSGDWKAKIDTKGLSDLHVVEVTIQPGGTSAGTATWGRAL
jgi:UDP-N-acetylglucosamine enolpyruvyl transferase